MSEQPLQATPEDVKKDADEVAAAIVNLNKALVHKYGPTVKAGNDRAAPIVKWGWIAWVTACLLGLQIGTPSFPTEFNWSLLNPMNLIHWVWPSNPFHPGAKTYSGVVPESSDAMLTLLKGYGSGIKVLLIYDSSKKLTPGQDSAMHAQVVVDYLNANCAMGPDGKTKEVREYAASVNLTNEAQEWRDQMAKPRTTVPWLIIWK